MSDYEDVNEMFYSESSDDSLPSLMVRQYIDSSDSDEDYIPTLMVQRYIDSSDIDDDYIYS